MASSTSAFGDGFSIIQYDAKEGVEINMSPKVFRAFAVLLNQAEDGLALDLRDLRSFVNAMTIKDPRSLREAKRLKEITVQPAEPADMYHTGSRGKMCDRPAGSHARDCNG